MGPTWGRQDPGGPHVGPMNLATWVYPAPGGEDRWYVKASPCIHNIPNLSGRGKLPCSWSKIIQAQIYNDGVWSLKMKRQCIWHDMVVLHIKSHGKWAAMSSPSLGQISSYWIKVRTQVRYPAGVSAPLCPQSTSSWIASHEPEAYG